MATFGMSIVNIFLWFVPISASEFVKFLWLVIGLVLVETFNTLYSTPYMALGTDISKNYNDRTRIQISKTIFFLVGMMVPSVLLYLFCIFVICDQHLTEYHEKNIVNLFDSCPYGRM